MDIRVVAGVYYTINLALFVCAVHQIMIIE